MLGRDTIKQAAERLRNGMKSERHTVRTFLSCFCMRRRTLRNIEYINSMLDEFHVYTKPDYLDVGLNDEIELVLKNDGLNDDMIFRRKFEHFIHEFEKLIRESGKKTM